MRQITPLPTRPRRITNTVEDPAQIMPALQAVLPAQQQIRQHKLPLFIRHIRRIPRT